MKIKIQGNSTSKNAKIQGNNRLKITKIQGNEKKEGNYPRILVRFCYLPFLFFVCID
jgi:hypothetical protein